MKTTIGLHANYYVLSEDDKSVTIKDIGPWNIHHTISKDKKHVRSEMRSQYRNKRLYYIDENGRMNDL